MTVLRGSKARMAVALFAGLCASSAASAADLTLLCAGAMKAPVAALLVKRDPALPHVAVTYGTAGVIRERIAKGEKFDLVIAPSDDVQAFIKEKRADLPSRRALGQTEVGVAVKAGAPVPDITTRDALRTALLAAKKVVIVDPAKGTSGRLAEALFRELQIEGPMRDKTIKVDGGYVVEAVARGEADLGLQQISEILPVAGVKLVGPLPGDLQRFTRYDLAVMSGTPHRADADALARDLSSPEARAVIVKNGFMPAR